MSTPHCSLDYHRFGVLKLETFADKVRKGIYENDPPFTTPPLTAIQFDTLIENYHHKYDDYKNGGILKKSFFMAAKAALIKGLDDTATFVDTRPGVNEEMILMGGYTPTKTVDSEGQIPAQPAGATITRGGAGEMFAEVPKVAGADYYGCIMAAEEPLPPTVALNASGQLIVMGQKGDDSAKALQPGDLFVAYIFDLTKSRKKRFIGLKTGTLYYFYFYAANATGVSILSEVRSLTCG